jgi:Tfp pilus assembly protein PilZ
MIFAQKRRAAAAAAAAAVAGGAISPALKAPSTFERRVNGLLRVPFVHRCALEFDDGRRDDEAFLVNINVLGAYVARDLLPRLGQEVSCCFAVPGNEQRVTLAGVVAWLNPRQQHPVHSLPPGFGLKFRDISGLERRRIEQVIEDYLDRQPRR